MSTANDIRDLITPNGKAGPDVTHGLKALGGTMQEGLHMISEFFYKEGLQEASRNLKVDKRNSFWAGSTVTACALSAIGVGVYWYQAHQKRKAEKQHEEDGKKILKCMQEATPMTAQEAATQQEDTLS